MSQRRRILFAGSGAFGLPTLRALVDAGFELPLIVSQPDKPAGRGRQLTPTPIAQLALDLRLPLLRTANINLETLPDADLLVVIAFGQKISSPIVNRPRLGSINLHASLLPRHRGAAPIHWAVLSGDEVTGNSVIRLADRMDAGAVLGTSQPRPIDLATTSELHDLLANDGPELVLHVIEQLFAGRAAETPQDESLATLAPKLNRDAARIDFAQPAELVARQIRAMYSWPGCRVTLQDHDRVVARLTLVRAQAMPTLDNAAPTVGSTSPMSSSAPPMTDSTPSITSSTAPITSSISPITSSAPPTVGNLAPMSGSSSPKAGNTAPPGTITADGSIVAGVGTVRVIEVQPEGGRPMTLEAFRNGRPWNVGMMLRPT